jgi:hypothetical protein
MNFTDELERLAALRAKGSLTSEEFAKAKSLLLSGQPFAACYRGVRRQSARKFFGLPLWAIATGPDPERGELRGHARAIFAVGDMATGWFACGGQARGIFAVGGLAVGVFALGGCAVGLLVAVGGGAVGFFAVGGGAVGYYALGGGAVGVHTLDAAHRDPGMVNFFQNILPGTEK